MIHDGEFIGIMEHLIDNTQAKVWFQVIVFFLEVQNRDVYIVSELEVQFRVSRLDQVLIFKS